MTNLNPYQSPTIAGEPPEAVPLPFRRRYWFEILIVANVLLLLIVATIHRGMHGVPEWYHYQPLVLFLVTCWLSAPALAICALLRSVLQLKKTSAWRAIATGSFAILVMLANLTATWIHPRLETDAARLCADLLIRYWPSGIPLP